MTDNYTRRRYGYNRNSHWWGKAHRARLIDTDQYIKTSERPRFTMTEVNPRAYKHCKGRLVPIEWAVNK